jgi:hypothetical protein
MESKPAEENMGAVERDDSSTLSDAGGGHDNKGWSQGAAWSQQFGADTVLGTTAGSGLIVSDDSSFSPRRRAKDPFSGLSVLTNAASSALNVQASEVKELMANLQRQQLLHVKKEDERKKATLAAEEEQAALAAATQTAHAIQMQFNNSDVQANIIKELRRVDFGTEREDFAEVLISVLQADGMDRSIKGHIKRLVYAILAANAEETLSAPFVIDVTAAYKALEAGGAPNPLSSALVATPVATRATAQCNADDKAISSVLLTKFLGKELEDVRAQLRSASEVGSGTSPTTRAMEMFLALKKHERPVSREAIRAAYQNILKAIVLFGKVVAVAPVLQALLDIYIKNSRDMNTLGLGVAASPAEYMIQVITQSPQNGGPWLTAMGSRLMSYVNIPETLRWLCRPRRSLQLCRGWMRRSPHRAHGSSDAPSGRGILGTTTSVRRWDKAASRQRRAHGRHGRRQHAVFELLREGTLQERLHQRGGVSPLLQDRAHQAQLFRRGQPGHHPFKLRGPGSRPPSLLRSFRDLGGVWRGRGGGGQGRTLEEGRSDRTSRCAPTLRRSTHFQLSTCGPRGRYFTVQKSRTQRAMER